MAQRVKLSGTRSPLLWLLSLLILAILGASIVVLLIWLPQRQLEQHYQAGVAFQNVEDWEMAADSFVQVIQLDADYKDTQSRLVTVKERQAEAQISNPSTRLSATPVLVQMPAPTPMATLPLPSLDGDWNLGVNVYRTRNSDASTSSTNDNYTIAIRLAQERELVTGHYLNTSGNACNNADINGEIQASEIFWTVHYTGSCCHDAKMTFHGTLDPTGTTITGVMEPDGLPPIGCYLWWADVMAFKR